MKTMLKISFSAFFFLANSGVSNGSAYTLVEENSEYSESSRRYKAGPTNRLYAKSDSFEKEDAFPYNKILGKSAISAVMGGVQTGLDQCIDTMFPEDHLYRVLFKIIVHTVLHVSSDYIKQQCCAPEKELNFPEVLGKAVLKSLITMALSEGAGYYFENPYGKHGSRFVVHSIAHAAEDIPEIFVALKSATSCEQKGRSTRVTHRRERRSSRRSDHLHSAY